MQIEDELSKISSNLESVLRGHCNISCIFPFQRNSPLEMLRPLVLICSAFREWEFSVAIKQIAFIGFQFDTFSR